MQSEQWFLPSFLLRITQASLPACLDLPVPACTWNSTETPISLCQRRQSRRFRDSTFDNDYHSAPLPLPWLPWIPSFLCQYGPTQSHRITLATLLQATPLGIWHIDAHLFSNRLLHVRSNRHGTIHVRPSRRQPSLTGVRDSQSASVSASGPVEVSHSCQHCLLDPAKTKPRARNDAPSTRPWPTSRAPSVCNAERHGLS